MISSVVMKFFFVNCVIHLEDYKRECVHDVTRELLNLNIKSKVYTLSHSGIQTIIWYM